MTTSCYCRSLHEILRYSVVCRQGLSDADLKILARHPDVSAWRMKSCRGARTTLEVAAGSVERHGVVPGQRLTWQIA